MKTYEVTVILKNGSYSTFAVTANNVTQAKLKALDYGEPVRIYYFAELVWQKAGQP